MGLWKAEQGPQPMTEDLPLDVDGFRRTKVLDHMVWKGYA